MERSLGSLLGRISNDFFGPLLEKIMNGFFASILGYPSVIYTILLGVVLVYWLLAVVGLVDFESGGPELDIDVDVDVDVGVETGHDLNLDSETSEISVLASYLLALGLGGVPFSVVVSLLVLVSWVISSIAAIILLPLVPTGILRFVAGTGVLIGAFLFSLPVVALMVRPMRKLFVSHNAISNASLVGQTCRIVTGTVDEKFGRAEVPARGAGYHIRVVADTPNNLTRGSTAMIIEYDEAASQYRVREAE